MNFRALQLHIPQHRVNQIIKRETARHAAATADPDTYDTADRISVNPASIRKNNQYLHGLSDPGKAFQDAMTVKLTKYIDAHKESMPFRSTVNLWRDVSSKNTFKILSVAYFPCFQLSQNCDIFLIISPPTWEADTLSYLKDFQFSSCELN